MSQIFQYEIWSPSGPDKLYNIGDFIDGDFYIKKRQTKWENLTAPVSFFHQGHRWCTVCLCADCDHTSY